MSQYIYLFPVIMQIWFSEGAASDHRTIDDQQQQLHNFYW